MRALHPRYWLVYLGISLTWILIHLLPYRVLMSIGKFLGKCGYLFSKRRRQIGFRNIEACFPEYSQEKRKKLLKQCFDSMGEGFAEMLMAWWMPLFRLKKIPFNLKGEKDLLAEPGRGLILCGGHFSSIEMQGCQFGLRYGKLHIVYQKHKDPIINKIINKGRSRYAVSLIDRTQLKSMIKVLRKGEYLWYAPDQDLGRHASVFVPFFNIPCATVRALGTLLKAGRARCLFAFFYRHEHEKTGMGYQFDTVLQSFPIENDDTQHALQYTQALERAILAHPGQYLWLHRRFKTRPIGEGKFYDF